MNKLAIRSGSLTHVAGLFSNLEINDGEFVLGIDSYQVNELALGNSSILNLGSSGEFIVLDSMVVDATKESPATVKAEVTGKLVHDLYVKYCFDHVNVTNVDLEGDVIINLGVDALISNSKGWLSKKCEDVLFANFETSFACVGSLVSFQNLSEGAIDTFRWDFGGKGSSSLPDPFFIFNEVGVFPVILEISNNDQKIIFEKEITISSNDLPKPIIVVNGSQLTSQQPSVIYQWYLNGQPIPDATERSIQATEDGSYQVAIFDDVCNRISDATVISSIRSEPDLGQFGIFVGPIPSENSLDVAMSNEYLGPVYFSLIDLSGRVVLEEEASKSNNKLFKTFSLPNSSGLYILRIQTNNFIIHKKVIKY